MIHGKNNIMDISVVIPTYVKRSCADVIESLKKQVFSGEFEILVIRNGSKKNIVSSDGVFRTIEIKKTGANIARNLGLDKSKAEIVVFIDDDVIVPKDWLKNIRIAHKKYRGPVIGGKVVPKWPKDGKPGWVKGVLFDYLSLLNYSPNAKIVHKWGWIVGANMSFKKWVFNEVGIFDETLDRVGDNLLSCGETELCDRIRSAGMDVYYDPSIVVKHIISKDRLNLNYFLRRAYCQGISDYYVDKKTMSVEKLKKKADMYDKDVVFTKESPLGQYQLVEKMCSIMRDIGYVQAHLLDQNDG